MPLANEGRFTTPHLAVLYEHRPWAEPLIAALGRRELQPKELSIRGMTVDPGVRQFPYDLVVNRISAFPGGVGNPRMVFAAREVLARLETAGVRVLNGYRCFVFATSKVRQLGLLTDLGLRCPRTRAIQGARQLVDAAAELTPPLIFKPNVGGSGAAIRVLETEEQVQAASHDYTLDSGADGIGIVQEYHRPWGGHIVRMEMLGRKLLYAVRQPVQHGEFNYCAVGGYNADERAACLEPLRPPPDAVGDARRIVQRAEADVAAIEYLVSERDGERYYFDINPFSNYVRDSELLGFDPTERLAAYIARQVINLPVTPASLHGEAL